jgi:hypothetical protein
MDNQLSLITSYEILNTADTVLTEYDKLTTVETLIMEILNFLNLMKKRIF